VVRELCQVRLQVRGIEPLQGLADATVQAHATRRSQFIIQRLTDEGVGELVPTHRLGQFFDHPRHHRLLQHVQDALLGLGVEDRAHLLQAELSAHDRGQAQQAVTPW
jgi:hypothetical protein